MFKNILVANDGSNCGNKSVDLAIDLAKKYNAKISALYIMDISLNLSFDDLDDAGGIVLDEITAKGKDAGVTVIEHIITANPIIDMETIVRKINPDIFILGAYGASFDNCGCSEGDLGSVAENALKVSKVPTLIVK